MCACGTQAVSSSLSPLCLLLTCCSHPTAPVAATQRSLQSHKHQQLTEWLHAHPHRALQAKPSGLMFTSGTRATTPPPSTRVQSYSPLSVSELRPGAVHHNRSLSGTLAVDPIAMIAIHSLLMDEHGDMVPVGTRTAEK